MSSAHTIRTDSAAKSAENAPGASQNGDPPVPNRFVRIDSGHPTGNAPGSVPAIPATDSLGDASPVRDSQAPEQSASAATDDRDLTAQREQSWLQLHAIELIGKLQTWAEDLDAREAQLNARTALLEHRERQLRLERQNSQLNLDELKATLQREVEEMRASARRMAFES